MPPTSPTYWLNSTLAALPALLWVYIGLGLPWALALLPRKDWRDRALVVCLALAVGPALLTAWMFVLGTVGGAHDALLRLDLILAGTVVLAAGGALLAWRKVQNYNARTQDSEPEELVHPTPTPLHRDGEGEGGLAISASWWFRSLAIDEKLLVALIAIALALRWLTTAYWPFTAYDELWVYGYEGRLYTLLGYIPQKIGYYPQFLPLQYTFAQLAVGGVDDHAARAMIPFLHVGSILAVYVLGARLFNRRTGIVAAALWALYPHVGEWAHVGDLEIVQTFLLTTMAAFFFMSWEGHEPRRRYAFIAGLILGIALWTKPTAGAFIWGVMLLIAVELVKHLSRDAAVGTWRPSHCEHRVSSGPAYRAGCIPLDGVWYVRNALLEAPAVKLPGDFWLALAQRGARVRLAAAGGAGAGGVCVV
jgi:hypothetical protein